MDEHFPPEVISDKITEGYFGQPANKTVSDRVSSYVTYLMENGFTEGSQLYRQINDKGVYEFFADEKYHVDSYIGTRGKQWLEKEAPADRPWFLTLSFPGPHMPFDGCLLYTSCMDVDRLFRHDLHVQPAEYFF